MSTPAVDHVEPPTVPVALRAAWRGLPLLLLCGVLVAAAASAPAAAVARGNTWLAPSLAALLVAPALALTAAAARHVLDLEQVTMRATPGRRARWLAAVLRAAPAVVPAQLAATSVALAPQRVPAPLLAAALAADLAVLACALVVLPFAYACAALGTSGCAASWRAGAAVVATRPALAAGVLVVAVAASVTLSHVAPLVLALVPGPGAVLVLAATSRALRQLSIDTEVTGWG